MSVLSMRRCLLPNLKSVALTILELLAFNHPKYRCHVTMTTRSTPFEKKLGGVMSVLSLRRCVSNLKSVALTILKLLAFNLRKFRGHVTLTTPTFWKTNLGVMSVLSVISCVSNLKSVALTILEILAFNPQKFRGHVTLAPPPFWKIFWVHVCIVPKNICTKLEDWNHFNRIEAIVFQADRWPLYPWPRFGQELTYFTKWAKLPILSFYLVKM